MTSPRSQFQAAERRRFGVSLAASLLLNLGVLLWAGGLAPPPVVRPPRARPHLGLIAFRVSPPAAAARQGAASHTRTAPVRPRRAASRAVPTPPQAAPPQPHQAQPHQAQPPRQAAPHILMPRVLVTHAPARREVPRPERRRTAGRPRIALPNSEIARALPSTLPPQMTLPPVALPALRVAPIVKKRPLPAPHPATAPASRPAQSARLPAPPARQGQLTAHSGAGHTAGRPPAGPFGIGVGLPWSDAPRHVVYVLDVSGSMKTRIRRADSELEAALRELHTSDTFNIIAFSDDSRLFDPDMAEVSPQSVQRAGDFLADLPLGGQTNLEGAIARALMLRDVNEVVVLTDGVPTVGDTDFTTLARSVRRINSAHARISTIGLVGVSSDGTDQSFEAAGLLEQIAHDSGGASKLVPLGQ